MTFREWFIHTLEGEDGKPSGKRIAAFWFVVLSTINAWAIVIIVWVLVFKNVTSTEIDIHLIEKLISLEMILCVVSLLFWGVISAQQVIQFKNGGGSNEPKADNPEQPVQQ